MHFINKILFACATLLLAAVIACGPASAANLASDTGGGTSVGSGAPNQNENKPQEKNSAPAKPEKPSPEKPKSLKEPGTSAKTSESTETVSNATGGVTLGKKRKNGEENGYKRSKDKKRVSTTVQIERVGNMSASQEVTMTEHESDKKASKSSGGESAPEKSYGRKNVAADVKYSSDTEAIQSAVEKAVDKRITRTEDLIRESQHSGPDFFTLLGFLGYIAGLLGLYSYVKTKQRKT